MQHSYITIQVYNTIFFSSFLASSLSRLLLSLSIVSFLLLPLFLVSPIYILRHLPRKLPDSVWPEPVSPSLPGTRPTGENPRRRPNSTSDLLIPRRARADIGVTTHLLFPRLGEFVLSTDTPMYRMVQWPSCTCPDTPTCTCPGTPTCTCPGTPTCTCPGTLTCTCPGTLTCTCPGTLTCTCPGTLTCTCPGTLTCC